MINWYINRLKTMSVSEIPYRLNQLVDKKIEKTFLKYLEPKHNLCVISKKILPDVNIENTYFESTISIFGKLFNYGKEPIDWHKDIFSNKEFPLQYAKSINIRKDPDLSAKNIWEINRMQFLPQLAINYVSTKNIKYLNQFRRIIESWNESNPYLTGINWYSNIEVNIRLINWFFSWEILNVDFLLEKDKDFSQFVTNIWLPLIYKHCKYSYSNPSKFSSANNHLISEYSGLFIAASKWKFKEADKWINYSKNGLELEIQKQHSKGINKEEAAEYIQFITDFFVLPYIVGKNTGVDFSLSYINVLEEIINYIYEFTDIKCNFPKYGDEDDGKVLHFSTDNHFNNFKSLLTTGAILFSNSKFKSKSSGYDLKNKLLFGEIGESIFNSVSTVKANHHSKFYKSEGHFIFKHHENNKEIYLHFDAAPLGFLSIAAHGHADALSFLMHINGFPFFVDSGTYCYHGAKDWRKYFVSTMAHNTICIDGQNQSNHAGDTMWHNHYKCSVLETKLDDEYEMVKATHTGYKNVVHTRTIEFLKDNQSFILTDDLKHKDGIEHNLSLLFHLHPEIIISHRKQNDFFLEHPSGIKVLLSLDQNENEVLVIKGQNNPHLGWYSDSFLQKVPTNVICVNKTINSSVKIVSKIKIYEY